MNDHVHAVFRDALGAMSAPQQIDVTVRRGVSQTEYRMTGELRSIFSAIEDLFRRWPAAGYGTRVHEIEEQPSGRYAARASHANSCD